MDRFSWPHRSPRRTNPAIEERVCRLRGSTKRGPAYPAMRSGVPASTIWRVLRRHGLNRLSSMDRPTGRAIRRYERAGPPRRQEGRHGPRGRPRPNAGGADAAATPTCTSPSMTTPESTRSRRSMANRPTPCAGSSGEPMTGTGPTRCPSTRSSPTTALTSA